ncbi:PAP2 superfamily protein [Dyadobacter koreensis]|uniref:PAP2 superfamily protein n=1 Tax=Dyadobacter koreensis TaxID=408657 RepID=A0A1H6W077_9BACT|nr:phosphatase PAP2 family protein [Dyadobacter koreensis]SEJ10329.1 PAP2 superfamily protein [Dyadobacter koreensis]
MRLFCLRHRSFFLPFFLIWIVLSIIQLLFTQNFIFLFVNKHWTPFADIFFKTCTHIGDGVFILVSGLVAALFSYRLAVKIFLSYAISGIVVQFLKQMVFAEIYRPPKILASLLPVLHKVEGVQLYHFNSFPSGHTTSAFALFTVLALECKSSLIKPFLLIPPLLVAYSRIYLLAHFLGDVYVAAFVAIPVSVLVYFYMNQYWAAQTDPRLDGGLTKLF